MFCKNGRNTMDRTEQIQRYLKLAEDNNLDSVQMVEGVKKILNGDYDVATLAELLHTVTCCRSHTPGNEGFCDFYDAVSMQKKVYFDMANKILFKYDQWQAADVVSTIGKAIQNSSHELVIMIVDFMKEINHEELHAVNAVPDAVFLDLSRISPAGHDDDLLREHSEDQVATGGDESEL